MHPNSCQLPVPLVFRRCEPSLPCACALLVLFLSTQKSLREEGQVQIPPEGGETRRKDGSVKMPFSLSLKLWTTQRACCRARTFTSRGSASFLTPTACLQSAGPPRPVLRTIAFLPGFLLRFRAKGSMPTACAPQQRATQAVPAHAHRSRAKMLERVSQASRLSSRHPPPSAHDESERSDASPPDSPRSARRARCARCAPRPLPCD